MKNVDQPPVLQPHQGTILGQHYLPSTPATVSWGWLPNRDSKAVLSIASGESVTFDTVSHEGILEEQGGDPVEFFGRFGVAPDLVMRDAIDIAKDRVGHQPADGPHVVTGPVEVRGAEPGDLLRVEVLDLARRAHYGIVSSRHGYGALPGEMPELDNASVSSVSSVSDPSVPSAEATVNVFCEVERSSDDTGMGRIGFGDGRAARFPLAPFLGLMGVAVDFPDRPHSVPPGGHGGNLDVNLLGCGSVLYLPVQVPGALFYGGDPHFAQGDGEVALTAFEAPLRATLRLEVLTGAGAREAAGGLSEPFAETDRHWIVIGLHEDLNEAMRRCVRSAVAFLASKVGMERNIAYAYLSAAADFEVSQVVDVVKGVHCVIRKSDFGLP
ncbi:MAG: acetamidase/formamidase family protein [Actinomycetota bacterium]|nr:acetamidase/formamidase family protein [Actinomycetota bacterium]